MDFSDKAEIFFGSEVGSMVFRSWRSVLKVQWRFFKQFFQQHLSRVDLTEVYYFSSVLTSTQSFSILLDFPLYGIANMFSSSSVRSGIFVFFSSSWTVSNLMKKREHAAFPAESLFSSCTAGNLLLVRTEASYSPSTGDTENLGDLYAESGQT